MSGAEPKEPIVFKEPDFPSALCAGSSVFGRVGHDYHSGGVARSMQALAMLRGNINRYGSEAGEHAGEQPAVRLTHFVFTSVGQTEQFVRASSSSSSAPRCETLINAAAISGSHSGS